MQDFADFDLNSPDGVFQEGLDLLESDHFEEALRAFDFVISEQPFNADALFHRGIALISLNRVEEAAAAYRSALAHAPTEALYHSHYGYALMRGGNTDEAIEHFDYALTLQPDSYQNKVYKACALAAGRNLGPARALLEEVLASHPDDIDVLRHYGGVLSLQGDDENAGRVFARILAADPNHVETIGRKAEMHLRAGRRDEALRCLREVVSLNPADAAAWQALLDLLAEQGMTEAVVALAGEAIAAGHEVARIYLHRARAYMNLKQTSQAITDLRRARDLDDRIPDAHYMLARAYADSGRLRPALACAARALQIAPHDARILMLMVNLQRRAGDHRQEAQYLDRILLMDPDQFHVLRMKADSLCAADRTEDALAAVRGFVARNPAQTAARILAAELAEKCGRHDEARDAFEQLFRFSPVTARACLAYAAFLIRRGDLPHASRVLASAVERFPRDARVVTTHAAALQSEGRQAECIAVLDRYFAAGGDDCPEGMWLRGKSLYYLRRHAEALECFQQARAMEARAQGTTAAPSFRFLLAEAFTLHHLDRTDEAIGLVERHFGQFGKSTREIYELLGDLCEKVGDHERARTLYSEGLRHFPRSAGLHYRAARVAATLGRRHAAIRQLAAAMQLRPEAAAEAAAEPAFRRYWASPALLRLIGRPLLRQPRFVGTLLAGTAALLSLTALVLTLTR